MHGALLLCSSLVLGAAQAGTTQAGAARWGLDPRASTWQPSTEVGGGPQRFGKEHFFRFDAKLPIHVNAQDAHPHG